MRFCTSLGGARGAWVSRCAQGQGQGQGQTLPRGCCGLLGTAPAASTILSILRHPMPSRTVWVTLTHRCLAEVSGSLAVPGASALRAPPPGSPGPPGDVRTVHTGPWHHLIPEPTTTCSGPVRDTVSRGYGVWPTSLSLPAPHVLRLWLTLAGLPSS